MDRHAIDIGGVNGYLRVFRVLSVGQGVVHAVVGMTQQGEHHLEQLLISHAMLLHDEAQLLVRVARGVDDSQDLFAVGQVGLRHIVAQTFPVLRLVFYTDQRGVDSVVLGQIQAERLHTTAREVVIMLVGTLGRGETLEVDAANLHVFHLTQTVEHAAQTLQLSAVVAQLRTDIDLVHGEIDIGAALQVTHQGGGLLVDLARSEYHVAFANHAGILVILGTAAVGLTNDELQLGLSHPRLEGQMLRVGQGCACIGGRNVDITGFSGITGYTG